MTAHVVFADPPLPAPTRRVDGAWWDVAPGAWVHLRRDGWIEAARGPWPVWIAQRMDLAMRAALRAAAAEWSTW